MEPMAFIIGAVGGICVLLLWQRFVIKPTPKSVPVSSLVNVPESQIERENAIVKSEARRYANLINLSNNPVWLRDTEMRLVFSNLAFASVAEEEDDVDDAFAALELFRNEKTRSQTVLETGTEEIFKQHIVVDGDRELYEVRITPVPGEEMVAGYAINISQLDESEEELKRYVSSQRDLLESSTNGMAIFGSDMQLKFYNFSYAALWKLEERWLDGGPTYAEVLEALRVNRRLPEQANFQMYKETRVKRFKELIEAEEEFFYLPDGKTLRVLAIPHALGGILFVYEDVTDRLALERSYNTLIAVQKETLDNLHEGVAVFNESGRLSLNNPAFLNMWKLDASDVISEPHVADFLESTKPLHAWVDWERYKQDFIGRVQARAIQAGRMERTDGKVLDWSSVPLPDGATLLTFIDVTDSKLVERSLREKNEALEAADRLKTEFLANVSYELRSPLTSIMGFADILLRGYVGRLKAEQKEYIQGIHDSSEQLSELIGNILDLASIEAGYLNLEISEVNIRQLFEETISLFNVRAEQKRQHIKIDISEEVSSFFADEKRLKQILFQLLSNAVKFTQESGRITLKAHLTKEKGVIVSVEDNGTGIESDRLEHVFETFFRSGPTYGDQVGSGLGLSMVKRLVELHGGNVEIRSAPKKGTKIQCLFPNQLPKEPEIAKNADEETASDANV